MYKQVAYIVLTRFLRVIKMNEATTATTTIAQANGYDYEQQKVLLDERAIFTQGVVFFFADYSASEFTEFYGAERDLIEIALRIQNFRGCATDCPAYLRSDILAWLRENDVE